MVMTQLITEVGEIIWQYESGATVTQILDYYLRTAACLCGYTLLLPVCE